MSNELQELPTENNETGNAVSTVLHAANIDTTGLVVPEAADIELIEDDVEAAMTTDRAFRALHIATGRAWLVMGEYAALVHKRKLWQHLCDDDGRPFTSFKDWCNNATQKGRTTVYGEMTLVRELNISREDIMNMSKANAFTLLKVQRRAGESKITPELIQDAISMDERDFAKHCMQYLPGAAADEFEYTVKFKVPESVEKLWKDTVEMMQILYQTNDWEVIIEHIANAAREAKFDANGGKLIALDGQGNWEAYCQVLKVLEATGQTIKKSGKQMKGSTISKEPVVEQDPTSREVFQKNTEGMIDGDHVALLGEAEPVDEDAALAALDEDILGDEGDDDHVVEYVCPQCGAPSIDGSLCGQPCI